MHTSAYTVMRNSCGLIQTSFRLGQWAIICHLNVDKPNKIRVKEIDHESVIALHIIPFFNSLVKEGWDCAQRC